MQTRDDLAGRGYIVPKCKCVNMSEAVVKGCGGRGGGVYRRAVKGK